MGMNKKFRDCEPLRQQVASQPLDDLSIIHTPDMRSMNFIDAARKLAVVDYTIDWSRMSPIVPLDDSKIDLQSEMSSSMLELVYFTHDTLRKERLFSSSEILKPYSSEQPYFSRYDSAKGPRMYKYHAIDMN